MGQRLDRPATAPTPTTTTTAASGSANSGGAANNANSLSTTFSSSSASSTSSSSSSTSTVNNNTTTNNSGDNPAAPRSSHATRHHHHHRRHVHRARGSVPDAHQAPASSSSLANMSPRTRFRTEMARRGYTNSSSDLFFRLFQFPSSSLLPVANSSGQEAATVPASTEVAVTPARSLPPPPPPPSSSAGSGGGLSAFRFFNLGSLGSSANNHELDSDLSSDEDEPHWNHNMNSLAQSLPFFFGMRGGNFLHLAYFKLFNK